MGNTLPLGAGCLTGSRRRISLRDLKVGMKSCRGGSMSFPITASFWFLLRVLVPSAAVIGVPLVLLPPATLIDVVSWQWLALISVFALIVLLHAYNLWPPYVSIRALRAQNQEKWRALGSFFKRASVNCFARGVNGNAGIRIAILPVVRTHLGFCKRLCLVHADSGLLSEQFSLWRKKDGFCGKCWRRGATTYWLPGDKPEGWDKMDNQKRQVRGDRSGICYPILDNRGRVWGVLYVDFERSVKQTGLTSKQNVMALEGLARTLFANEFPQPCILGKV